MRQIIHAPAMIFGEVHFKALDEGKQQLMATSYVEEEVGMALKMMHPSKAPRPHGFHAEFYQKYWSLIKGEITSLALKFLIGGRSIANINQTFIVLIPKVKRSCKYG